MYYKFLFQVDVKILVSCVLCVDSFVVLVCPSLTVRKRITVNWLHLLFIIFEIEARHLYELLSLF